MKTLLCAVALSLAFAGSTFADDDAGRNHYTLTSLNAPDPVFVPSSDSVPINVTAEPAALARKLAVRLNGDDITFQLSSDGAGSLSGTVTGLQPGINTFEVFESRRAKKAVATLKVARGRAPVAACSAAAFAAAALPVANTVITSVTMASTPVPHCVINGTINAGRVGTVTPTPTPPSRYTYQITWQARLPNAWNSKFDMPGGGGTDGSVPGTTSRLAQGYAQAANDSGHNNGANSDPLAGGTASFGTDFQARVDFAYNAIDVTTQTAKALVNYYYGMAPVYSYFEGCSMGGREAMMVTQRLPAYFNGVVVGDPALGFPRAGVKTAYYAHQLSALATSMGLISGFGVPYVNNTYTLQDLQLVSKAILDACDARDGLVDGMVNNSRACTTAVVRPHLDALQCTSGKTPACLTADQITTLVNLYDKGAPNSQGVPQYAKWMWDPGIAGCTSAVDCNAPDSTNIGQGWRQWNIGPYNANFVPNVSKVTNGATTFNLGGGAVPVIDATPPYLPSSTANDGLPYQLMTMDIDELARRIFAATPEFPVSSWDLLNVNAVDLSPFRNAGGKVVIWQPQSGGPFSAIYMVSWYTDMSRHMHHGKGRDHGDKADSFARLFLMPGANHCGGGPATSNADFFSPVVNWVENGVAPESVVGTAPAATPWPGRTRPLCPYPQYAHYKGSGDINVASNFECRADRHHHEEEEDHATGRP
jgi:feruloyl esterase